MPSLPRAVVAIGVFDGVHLGHQGLLRQTAADARRLGVEATAITFDRDPDQVVTPDRAAPQLLTLDDKLALIGQCGIDTTLVVPFTEAIASMHAEQFLDGVVASAVEVATVRVGLDFRFGSEAEGDLDALRSWGTIHNASVVGHDLVEVDGAPVTSTRIRALVAEGHMVAAARLLGRPHRISGVVRKGRGEGERLGFPTANIATQPYAALPQDGVYAGRALVPDGSALNAAVSVGIPPTFRDARDRLEAHLLDFSGDLQGRIITIEFFERLRDLRTFDSAEELAEAIAADVERVRLRACLETDADAAQGPLRDDPRG